jgi:hypothetical protein
MADIKLSIDLARDLTTVTIVGALRSGELGAVLADYYKQSPTRLIMMDSREGSWSSIATIDYKRSIHNWIMQRKSREGGKTAIIFSDPADYGMGRYLESHLSMAGIPTELECFRDIEKAERWLFGSA